MEAFLSIITPSAADYAKTIVNVIGAKSLPARAIFFNAFGQPILPSDYLSDNSRVEKIWQDTDELIRSASAAKKD